MKARDRVKYKSRGFRSPRGDNMMSQVYIRLW